MKILADTFVPSPSFNGLVAYTGRILAGLAALPGVEVPAAVPAHRRFHLHDALELAGVQIVPVLMPEIPGIDMQKRWYDRELVELVGDRAPTSSSARSSWRPTQPGCRPSSRCTTSCGRYCQAATAIVRANTSVDMGGDRSRTAPK